MTKENNVWHLRKWNLFMHFNKWIHTLLSEKVKEGIPKRICSNRNMVECNIKHFRPTLVHWNESVYCTPIDRALKMRFNEWSGSFLRPTIPELWRFLWNQLRQNKYTNIRRFSTISGHKIRIFSFQKVRQNTVLSKMATQDICN